MKQWWSCYNQSPSGRLLGVELDYLLYSKVSAGCIPQEDYTPLHVRGDLSPLQGSRGANSPLAGGFEGQWSLGRGSGVAPPKLKIDVKLPCKNLVNSSQSGLFIRRMI